MAECMWDFIASLPNMASGRNVVVSKELTNITHYLTSQNLAFRGHGETSF
jgi:hypothetical protein